MRRPGRGDLLIVGIGYVVWILACGGGGSTRTGITTEAPVATISASELVDLYQQNEVAGDQRFKGKVLVVVGTVDQISKDILDTPFVILRGKPEGVRAVQASFNRGDEAKLAPLQKGQVVAVKCRGQGLLMHVQLSECQVAQLPAK